ncbi:hypothetical protein ACQP1O_19985 [Nocardia sp. CA-151230]|uniref:hypothetical protein n=1 Tax=Nocardia sp. CA-151230 TaxID=3239982 RepID=UPI003D91A4FF
MLLVPAVMSIFGDAVWWLPRPLARLLPSIDIEGRAFSQPTTVADLAAEEAMSH